MTYVQYINCDKWKKVIGITLWLGATIGLVIGTSVCYEGIVNPLPIPVKPSIGNLTQSIGDYETQDQAYWNAINTNQNSVQLFYLGLLVNILNFSAIGIVSNYYYKWIAIKCGVKPKTEQVE